MKASSQEVLSTGVRLVIICAAAALVLGILNEMTEPVIVARKAAEQQAVIDSFVTSGEAGAPQGVDDPIVRSVVEVKSAGKIGGYILVLVGVGYGGDLVILASYAPDGAIRAARLMDNTETPGLGKKAESDEYMQMFVGTGADRPVPVNKNMLAGGDHRGGTSPRRAGFGPWMFGEAEGSGGGADTITGATLTFNGVSQALAAGSDYVKRRSR